MDIPTSEVNGQQIPQAGTYTSVVQDPIGGWIYTITATVNVQQDSANDIRARLDAAKQAAAQAQAVVDDLEPQVASFLDAVAQAQDAQADLPANP